MSTVPQPTCTFPAAYASRMATGSSMSVSFTLKVFPPGPCQAFPGSNPLLARMIGAHPAQTLRAKVTTLSVPNGS